MGTGLSFKRFGARRGKRKLYRLADTCISKDTAAAAARGFRARGDNARVIGRGGVYLVYVRDAPSRRKRLGYA